MFVPIYEVEYYTITIRRLCEGECVIVDRFRMCRRKTVSLCWLHSRFLLLVDELPLGQMLSRRPVWSCSDSFWWLVSRLYLFQSVVAMWFHKTVSNYEILYPRNNWWEGKYYGLKYDWFYWCCLNQYKMPSEAKHKSYVQGRNNALLPDIDMESDSTVLII